MKIVLIGSGNVATVLGRKMFLKGHIITQVFSPNPNHARTLATNLNSAFTSSLQEIDQTADLYLIAIADEGLVSLSKHFHLDKKMAVHTAGSVSKDILKELSRNYGVIYPLQSLHKELEQIPTMPLLIDANTIENLTLIRDFANDLSDQVEEANDEKRLKLHLAAVIVNNFSNHLFALAEAFCKREKLDFSLLWPLIEETGQRLRYESPLKVQTGPAIRNDWQTMAKHTEILENDPELKNIYLSLSRSIVKFRDTKKDRFPNSGI